jgi:acyl dehydratase
MSGVPVLGGMVDMGVWHAILELSWHNPVGPGSTVAGRRRPDRWRLVGPAGR